MSGRQTLASLAGAAALLTSSSALFAEPCTCPGAQRDRYAGGDSAPLTWAFETKLMRPGTADVPALVCYLRRVDNKSNSDVRNVRWEVANYFRAFIPAAQTRSACPPIPGEMNTTLSNGPLHFGITSQGYETTVRQPKAGWPSQTSSAVKGGVEWPLLTTVFSVDFPGDGAVRTADIVVLSAATQGDGVTTLEYDIKNIGPMFIEFAADLPIEMSERLPFAQKGILLKANDRLNFKVTFPGRPQPVPSSLVIYGPDHQVAAIETAGLYVTDRFKLNAANNFMKNAWGSILKR